jgi:hypothetical protein
VLKKLKKTKGWAKKYANQNKLNLTSTISLSLMPRPYIQWIENNQPIAPRDKNHMFHGIHHDSQAMTKMKVWDILWHYQLLSGILGHFYLILFALVRLICLKVSRKGRGRYIIWLTVYLLGSMLNRIDRVLVKIWWIFWKLISKEILVKCEKD